MDAEATSPNLPVEHAVQALVPVMRALNVPATHAVQAADVFVAATLLYAPIPHAVHTSEVDADATSPYLPV